MLDYEYQINKNVFIMVSSAFGRFYEEKMDFRDQRSVSDPATPIFQLDKGREPG